MEKEQYIIEGIANSNMKTQLKNALTQIDGVNQVCIDMKRERVEVMYSSPATASKIKTCIYSTGHSY